MGETNGTTKVIPPSKLAHVVLRTNQMNRMVEFYTLFLGGRVVQQTPMLSFMTYDDEHHRIAFIEVPDVQRKVRNSCGLEHIAFTWDSLTDLLTAYRQRLSLPEPIKPVWCTNHGPTTSLYYKDPDGNILETQYDNQDVEGTNAIMASPEFAENPIGVDFDPEEMWRRLQEEGEGKLAKEAKSRPNIGPRGIESVPVDYLV